MSATLLQRSNGKGHAFQPEELRAALQELKNSENDDTIAAKNGGGCNLETVTVAGAPKAASRHASPSQGAGYPNEEAPRASGKYVPPHLRKKVSGGLTPSTSTPSPSAVSLEPQFAKLGEDCNGLFLAPYSPENDVPPMRLPDLMLSLEEVSTHSPTTEASPRVRPSPSSPGVSSPSPVYSSPMMTPMCSPMFTPMRPPSASFQGNWRRSFVERARAANRKVEYIYGSGCSETREVQPALTEALHALEEGLKPDLVEDGCGGTYFVKDRSGRKIAVFKPRDEEPLAPNNPKVHAGRGLGEGLKNGVLVGDAAVNEYAAFLLDRAGSAALRAGVCPTALVRIADSVFHDADEGKRSDFRKVKDKVGSFQLFAESDCTSEDMGPSRFPTNLVHRLAVLDIRLCNADRHAGNILVKQTEGKVTALCPIDHGYALPGKVVAAAFEWLSWPAAHEPFSAEIKMEILNIKVDRVEAKLKKRVPSLRHCVLKTLRICTALLQHGVKAGLTAAEIGGLMCPPDCGSDEEQPLSVLEEMVKECEAQLQENGKGREDFFECDSDDEASPTNQDRETSFDLRGLENPLPFLRCVSGPARFDEAGEEKVREEGLFEGKSDGHRTPEEPKVQRFLECWPELDSMLKAKCEEMAATTGRRRSRS
eukprot:TRINITY_DN111180_c0_g1_i1.p1 TRINITY_DN111180_c0_g1~~TRINITY_DN111180_c0_g1_i1.p1  ORF type:complete len:683 (-),score=115.25 TRINITY_DN111180_c0_g1_i1:151-2100(-)